MELAVAEGYSVLEEDTCSSQDAVPMYFQRDLKVPCCKAAPPLRLGVSESRSWTFLSVGINHMKGFCPGCWAQLVLGGQSSYCRDWYGGYSARRSGQPYGDSSMTPRYSSFTQHTAKGAQESRQWLPSTPQRLLLLLCRTACIL